MNTDVGIPGKNSYGSGDKDFENPEKNRYGFGDKDFENPEKSSYGFGDKDFGGNFFYFGPQMGRFLEDFCLTLEVYHQFFLRSRLRRSRAFQFSFCGDTRSKTCIREPVRLAVFPVYFVYTPFCVELN